MCRLLLNEASFVLIVLVLQLVVFTQTVECQELNIRSLLKRVRKNDSFKLDGLLQSLGEKTIGLLDNLLPTDEQSEFDLNGTIQKAGKLLSGLKEKIFSESPSGLNGLFSKPRKQENTCEAEANAETEADEQLGKSRIEREQKDPDDLFSDFEPPEDQTEVPSESIETGLYSVTRDEKNDRASVLVSVLKDLRLMFSIPIKVIHTKYAPQIDNREQHCDIHDYCLET